MLDELQPGKLFHGRYEVVRCIRAGGMGAVYEVIHLETKRHRALKVMLPSLVRDQAMRNRFRLEAQITADVESDHIVETFDAGVDTETGAPFIVMELLRGEDLARHLSARRTLPPEEVVGIVVQLARALEQTHASGIVHRDLKPENLFLAVRGDDPPRLKVLDFGIAKIVAQSSSAYGTTNIGTPLYMSPEQLDGGQVSPRTDLFTVGHIAFNLLTGRPYWAEEADAIGILPLVDRLSRGPVEAATVRAERRGVTLPPAFDRWFARSTAVRPEQRFERATAQALALADALSVSAKNAPVPRPLAAGQRPEDSERRRLFEQETAAAPISVQTSELRGARGSSPMSASAVVAPTSRSGDLAKSARPAPAVTSTPPEAEDAATLQHVSETHHSSVRSVNASPRNASRLRLLALVAAAAIGAGAVAVLRPRSGPAPSVSSSDPTAAGARAEVTTHAPPELEPSGASTAPSLPAGEPGGASPLAPHVDPSASVSAVAPPSPRPEPKTRTTTVPAAKPPPKAARDPSRVFD